MKLSTIKFKHSYHDETLLSDMNTITRSQETLYDLSRIAASQAGPPNSCQPVQVVTRTEEDLTTARIVGNVQCEALKRSNHSTVKSDSRFCHSRRTVAALYPHSSITQAGSF